MQDILDVAAMPLELVKAETCPEAEEGSQIWTLLLCRSSSKVVMSCQARVSGQAGVVTAPTSKLQRSTKLPALRCLRPLYTASSKVPLPLPSVLHHSCRQDLMFRLSGESQISNCKFWATLCRPQRWISSCKARLSS